MCWTLTVLSVLLGMWAGWNRAISLGEHLGWTMHRRRLRRSRGPVSSILELTLMRQSLMLICCV